MNYYIHTKTGTVQVDRATAEYHSKRGSKVTSKTMFDSEPHRTKNKTEDN